MITWNCLYCIIKKDTYRGVVLHCNNTIWHKTNLDLIRHVISYMLPFSPHCVSFYTNSQFYVYASASSFNDNWTKIFNFIQILYILKKLKHDLTYKFKYPGLSKRARHIFRFAIIECNTCLENNEKSNRAILSLAPHRGSRLIRDRARFLI